MSGYDLYFEEDVVDGDAYRVLDNVELNVEENVTNVETSTIEPVEEDIIDDDPYGVLDDVVDEKKIHEETDFDETPTLAAPISVDHHRDWNAEWQTALAMKDPVERACTSAKILTEFENKILMIVKDMVQDLALPHEKRRYLIRTKGVAGGDKYRFENVFLKFVRDRKGIYGDDSYAGKAAENERKGLRAYYDIGTTDLAVPLFGIVTYLGWNIVATPVLPLSAKSLVYGSDDQGQTVRLVFSSLQ